MQNVIYFFSLRLGNQWLRDRWRVLAVGVSLLASTRFEYNTIGVLLLSALCRGYVDDL